MRNLNFAVLAFSGLLLVDLVACESYPELVLDDNDLIGTGGSGNAGGQAGAPSNSSSIDGVVIGSTASSSGGSAGSPVVGPCDDAAACGPGQRCEEDDGEALCIDNECADLDCSATQECLPANGGGHVCTSIACESDVDCPVSRFCDGEKCVDDACEPGIQRCDGEQVLRCTSNGAEEVSHFSCGSDAYFSSSC